MSTSATPDLQAIADAARVRAARDIVHAHAKGAAAVAPEPATTVSSLGQLKAGIEAHAAQSARLKELHSVHVQVLSVLK